MKIKIEKEKETEKSRAKMTEHSPQQKVFRNEHMLCSVTHKHWQSKPHFEREIQDLNTVTRAGRFWLPQFRIYREVLTKTQTNGFET